jgi:DNA polymerase
LPRKSSASKVLGDLKKIKMSLETNLNLGINEVYSPAGSHLSLGKDSSKVKDNLGIKKRVSMAKNELSLEEKISALEKLKTKVIKCQKCPLYKSRTNAVFGQGSPQARLMFVGEAPGRDEDLQGKPFVGRAGKLLTKIIEAMGLKREEVYIANILKDRPPANRNPQDDEIKACVPYLKEQIKIIQPEVICGLGTFAAQRLLELETPISKLRGKFFLYEGINFMPTYHPAYLLRNPKEKSAVWSDMKLIMQELNLKVK